MKRIVLFSTPTPTNIDKILARIFPAEMKKKIFAYMPSDGRSCPQNFIDEWKGYAQKNGAEFRYIDNSKPRESNEAQKLLDSNILAISGGNTFKLLDNLRKSGLDKAIIEFARKDEFVLSGFSAGALVLTPTIEICNLPIYDENQAGLKDFTGLGIVDFEVFPHYEEASHEELLNKYRSTAKHEVKEITNEGYLEINL